MSYDIEGKVKAIYPKEIKSERFQFREIVLEVQDGAYMQYPKLQFTQDRVDLLDNFKEGDHVLISFNIKGREYNGKYWNTLEGWRIKASDSDIPVINPPDPDEVLAVAPKKDPFDGVEWPTAKETKVVADDLPF